MIFITWAYALFASFLIYASVRRAWHSLKPVVKLLLIPFMVLWLLDVGFNFIFGTMMFLELPRQWTLSARCALHKRDYGFRGTLARAICNHLLNPFDPNHCE